MVFSVRNVKVDATSIQGAIEEVELPVVKKFLFCFPLRPALVVWGFVQLAAASFTTNSQHAGSTFALVQMIAMFIFTMIVSFLEFIFCAFLVYGAQSSNPNVLEVCFYYLMVKVPAYLLLWLASVVIKNVMVSDYWYQRNLDPWRYTLFMYSQAVGLNDIIAQFYLLILVRSMILQMKHRPHLPSLYQRLKGGNQIAQVQDDDTRLNFAGYETEIKTEFVPVHKI